MKPTPPTPPAPKSVAPASFFEPRLCGPPPATLQEEEELQLALAILRLHQRLHPAPAARAVKGA